MRLRDYIERYLLKKIRRGKVTGYDPYGGLKVGNIDSINLKNKGFTDAVVLMAEDGTPVAIPTSRKKVPEVVHREYEAEYDYPYHIWETKEILKPAVSSGEGIPVSTPQDLYNIRNNPSGHYVLTNDIDMSGFGPFPYIPDFSGVLDGRGFAIKNLVLSTSSGYVGLMTVYHSIQAPEPMACAIKNIRFENVSLSSPVGANNFGLGIIADAWIHNGDLTLSNIYLDINAEWTGEYGAVGGLIGYLNTYWDSEGPLRITIKNCQVNATFKGLGADDSSIAGALVGDMNPGINAPYTTTITIQDCVANIDISDVSQAGGLMGSLWEAGPYPRIYLYVERCRARGKIKQPTGYKRGAGLIGKIYTLELGLYYDFQIRESSFIGYDLEVADFAGIANMDVNLCSSAQGAIQIKDCYARLFGTVTSESYYVGGLAYVDYFGNFDPQLIVENCYTAGLLNIESSQVAIDGFLLLRSLSNPELVSVSDCHYDPRGLPQSAYAIPDMRKGFIPEGWNRKIWTV